MRGVHPTRWRTQRRQGRGYIRPPGEHQCTAPATQITAELRRPSASGRTSGPLESSTRRACQANRAGAGAATKRPRHTSDPLVGSKYPACHANQHPWRAARAARTAPATQITPAQVRRQATSGRASDPLERSKYHACHANHTGARSTNQPTNPRAYIRLESDNWLMTIG